MWRFAVGAVAALVLMTAGAVLWQTFAQQQPLLPDAPPPQAFAAIDAAGAVEVPRASEKTREEKRFSRYDRDKNGAVSREEYLASRRKAYARLDRNGDGLLSFEEYAVKTAEKFATADRDKTGALTPAEFLTTRVVRKTQGRVNCPPPSKANPAPAEGDSDEA